MREHERVEPGLIPNPRIQNLAFQSDAGQGPVRFSICIGSGLAEGIPRNSPDNRCGTFVLNDGKLIRRGAHGGPKFHSMDRKNGV